MIVTKPIRWSTQLPHRLEAQSAAAFYVEKAEMEQAHLQHKVAYADMRPFVTLGTGERVSSRGVPVEE